MKNKKSIIVLITIILGVLALLTLFLSSAVIFDWFSIRAKEGNYVLFIVWTNFISSILYLTAVYGFIKSKKWTFWILNIALLILVIAFVALLIHIYNGGIHEVKTIKAMIFRMMMTLTFSIVAFFYINKQFKET